MQKSRYQILTLTVVIVAMNTLQAQPDQVDSVSHGNVTAQGPTGLFINPTSSTLKKNEFLVQYCAAVLESNNDDNILEHNAITSYGVTDWFELGVFGQAMDRDKAGVDTTLSGVGPFARLRMLREEYLRPELSIGGISLNGGADPEITKHTIFAAASKRAGLRERGCPVDVRFHTGVRTFWKDNGDNDEVVYFGGEIELPRHMYVVSEVSTEADSDSHIPFSIGFQVRHPDGVGLSLATFQPGNQSELAVFVGIGINYDFLNHRAGLTNLRRNPLSLSLSRQYMDISGHP